MSSFESSQVVDAFKDGLAGSCRPEGDGFQDVRQKAPHRLVSREHLRLVILSRRPRHGVDGGDRLSQVFFWQLGEGRRPHLAVGAILVEQNEADIGKLEGGLVQIMQGAQAFLHAQAFGAGGDIGDQQIEQVQGVVEGFRLVGIGEGNQRCPAPLIRHASDAGHPARCRIPCQCLQSHRRDAGEVEVANAKAAQLPMALQCRAHGGAADPPWTAAQAVEGTSSLAIRHLQKGLKPGALLITGQSCQPSPGARGCPLANLRDQTCQRRRAGQKVSVQGGYPCM